jgi:hypothetical protein
VVSANTFHASAARFRDEIAASERQKLLGDTTHLFAREQR